MLYIMQWLVQLYDNHISGVMVSSLASKLVDHRFEPRKGHTKDYYDIGIRCFSALRRKSKDCLARNQANVPEWDDMFIRGLFFQWASIMKIQLSVLVWYRANIIIISLKINLLSPWYSWKIAEYELKSKHAAFPLETQYSGLLVGSELVSYCCLTPNDQFGSYIMAGTRNIRWDGVRFLLGQQG